MMMMSSYQAGLNVGAVLYDASRKKIRSKTHDGFKKISYAISCLTSRA